MNTNRYLVTFKRTLIEHVSFEVVAENDLEAGDLAEQHLNAGLHNAEWSADEPAEVEIVDCEEITPAKIEHAAATTRAARLTFEEFQASGRDVVDLDQATGVGDDSLEGKPGRVYADRLYIEKEPDGRWHLLIENHGWVSHDLTELEGRLYNFGCQEGCLMKGAS